MFEVQVAGGFGIFDSVVVCTPAYIAAELLEPMDPAFSDRLASVEYPPISVVYTGFKKSDVRFDPDGFGFLVPGLEKRKILGSLWTSSVFAGRVPEGHHLMTTFIGGARNPELAKRSEDELIEIAVGEIDEVLGLQGEPVFTRVKKWERAIPQYNIGYENVVSAIDNFQQQNPGLFLCSNFYGGISVGDCVKNSLNTTRAVLEFLEND
jgi:oxygen-dependent protoporphyrinogen oxidase